MRDSIIMTDMTAMQLSYSNLDHRWINLHVGAEQVQYTLYVSSLLNDCMADLLNAVIRLWKRSSVEHVVFWEEPSSFIWRLTKENDRILVERYFSKDYQPIDSFLDKYLEKAEFLDSFETDLKTLTNRVIAFVARFQDTPGIEQYEESWRRPFPVNELKCLKGLRGTTE